MSNRSFAELRNEVFALHAGRHYVDALELLGREAIRFPGQWSETLYWQACLTALVGDVGGALSYLQEAVNRGHWWLEGTLRDDPDLQVLQNNPRFEALVLVCKQRQQRAQAEAKPDLIVLTPRNEPPWPLLIALHGAGGTAAEFAQSLGSATVEGWLVAVPQSSQVVSPAGYGWGDGDRALKEVCGHYQTMVRDYPVDLNRVVVGGFSQGGTAAISMALSGSVPVRGILGIACAPRSLNEVREAIGGTSVREMRLYLLVGDKDHVLKRATDFAEILKSAGMTARLDIRPALGHELPDDFGRSLVAALEFLGS